MKGPDGTEVDEAAFIEAVSSQRPMVRGRLAQMGWSAKTEEVMATVMTDTWLSLVRWAQAGRPPLSAWACGVARNTVREWLRKDRPGRVPGGQGQSLDDMLVDPPATEPGPESSLIGLDPDAAAVLVNEIRDRVLAQEGGSARWARLLSEAELPERGGRARTELRGLLFSLGKTS